ncbi:hypothetical protein PHLGIDRAFT_253410 [Phlebiopsis gigantea 11061_1 CR5-6]|uniref:F-box domain-containing protein n=1 Tax=Phlebiopsis gigantea (strain 11061_1 CR5-6) TaxID=745531 RepID=A0A0C3S4T0_PHLG1|nr:hypothetical protein PHLGIDRAFT_253410 [Phlebiopsis gigantea 11061_1 CR5-6]
MSTLPPELLDHIFSLAEDATILRACSLVCYTWLLIARGYLFATLRTQEGQLKPCRGITDLTRTLLGSSSLGHAVKSLVVDGLRSDAKLPVQDLVSVLRHLPRLQHLAVCNTRIPSFQIVAPFQERTSLHSLRLCNVGVYVDNPANILRLLDLFESIGELTLEKVWFKYSYGMSSRDTAAILSVPSYLRITSLILHGADDRAELLLDSFLLTQVRETLRALHLSFYDFAPLVPCVSRFLSDPRCQLHNLALDFSRCFPYTFWSHAPGLRATQCAIEQVLQPPLPALRSLRRFALHTGNVPHEASAFWDMCLAVLGALPLSVVEVHVDVVNGAFGFDVPGFVRVLQRYGDLEGVFIHGLGDEKRLQGVAESVEKLLPNVNVQYKYS